MLFHCFFVFFLVHVPAVGAGVILSTVALCLRLIIVAELLIFLFYFFNFFLISQAMYSASTLFAPLFAMPSYGVSSHGIAVQNRVAQLGMLIT